MMPMKLIVNGVNTKINGILHYGDALDAEIADYEFSGVKKVIWIHPNNESITNLYPKTASRNYRSQYVPMCLSNEDKQFEKRLETYVKDNIVYVDLDSFNLIKLNPIRNVSYDASKIVEGFGDLLDKFQSIRGVCVAYDSKEIESKLDLYGFDKMYSIDQASLYVRKG